MNFVHYRKKKKLSNAHYETDLSLKKLKEDYVVHTILYGSGINSNSSAEKRKWDYIC